MHTNTLTHREMKKQEFPLEINDIQSKTLKNFIIQLSQKEDTVFRFCVVGITGSGKTTLVEYLLNILLDKLLSPTPFRIIDEENLEAAKKGSSMTQFPTQYIITYNMGEIGSSKTVKIILIDTPGLGDVEGEEKDKKHLSDILHCLAKLPKIHSMTYVVPSTLTRKKFDDVMVVVKLFSVIPKDVIKVAGLVVTFTPSKETAKQAQGILKNIMDSFGKFSITFLQNPWASHLQNQFKSMIDVTNEEDSVCFGETKDSTNELSEYEGRLLDYLQFFFLNRVYVPNGIAELLKVKNNLLHTLGEVNSKINHINDVAQKVKVLCNTNKLQEMSKISLESFASTRNLILKGGKFFSKELTQLPFGDDIYSTVCFAPQCENLICHKGCGVSYTSECHESIFQRCRAMDGREYCVICNRNCSHKYHLHSRYHLEIIERGDLLEQFNLFKNPLVNTKEELDKAEKELNQSFQDYQNTQKEFVELKAEFVKLSTFGDLGAILETYIQLWEKQLSLLENDLEKKDQEVQMALKQSIANAKQTVTELEIASASNTQTLIEKSKDLISSYKEQARKVCASIVSSTMGAFESLMVNI